MGIVFQSRYKGWKKSWPRIYQIASAAAKSQKIDSRITVCVSSWIPARSHPESINQVTASALHLFAPQPYHRSRESRSGAATDATWDACYNLWSPFLACSVWVPDPQDYISGHHRVLQPAIPSSSLCRLLYSLQYNLSVIQYTTSENMAIACFVDYSTLMPTYCFLFLLFLII